MEIRDEQVARAVTAAYQDAARELHGSWMPPASAKVRDFPDDLEGLRAADAEAEAINHAAMRRILEAALATETSLDAVRKLVDSWVDVPDYLASDYDRGRVDQRHDMVGQLLEVLNPE